MKYTVRILAVVAVALLPLASCNDRLDIKPRNTVLTDEALTTSADVESALVGAYDVLGSERLYGGRLQMMGELLADDGDVAFVGTFVQPAEAYRKTLLTNNSFVATAWTDAYRVINITNNVLASLDKVAAPRRNQVEGGARFIRGMVYFDLLRHFARDWNDGSPQSNPGVPLMLTPTTVLSSADQVPRNSVAEVYTQVLLDLAEAKRLLPNSNGFFANKFTAAAVQSRVFLQQRRYADAAAAAGEVIASGRYTLTPTVAQEFTTTSNTSEDVFALQVSNQDGVNELNTFFAEQSRADIEIQDQHLDRYETGDERADLISAAGYTTKFNQIYGNVKLIRLAEMYLTRAESRFRTGNLSGALADVNVIRERAGLDPFTAADLTLAAILNERRKELSFEGFRLHDIKRNQERVINRAIGVNVDLPFNSPRLIFPIPQRERDVNPNLIQNEGYN